MHRDLDGSPALEPALLVLAGFDELEVLEEEVEMPVVHPLHERVAVDAVLRERLDRKVRRLAYAAVTDPVSILVGTILRLRWDVDFMEAPLHLLGMLVARARHVGLAWKSDCDNYSNNYRERQAKNRLQGTKFGWKFWMFSFAANHWYWYSQNDRRNKNNLACFRHYTGVQQY